VVKISQDQAGVEVTTGKNSYKARFVIVAMPPYLSGRINYDPPLPATRQQLTQRFPMGTLAKILISYESPFWREKGLAGVGMGNSKWIELFADSSDPRSGKGVIATFVMGDRYHRWQVLTETERRSAILSDLAAYLGEQALLPTSFDVLDWPANPWVGGGYAAFLPPGVWTNFGDAIASPVGRIHWAGTEIAERWPGFFDGAVRTGEAAAEAVIGSLQGE
jgi:monoamine oxidase